MVYYTEILVWINAESEEEAQKIANEATNLVAIRIVRAMTDSEVNEYAPWMRDVRGFSPTTNPIDCRRVTDDADDAMFSANSPEQVLAANRVMMRAIDTEDLMRAHCE